MATGLRNVPMGFFHDHSMGELTATMTSDLNYLENYSMHILDKVTSGVLTMIVMAICVLTFDWRIGIVFLLGIFLSFPVYTICRKRERICPKNGKQFRRMRLRPLWNMCRGFRWLNPLICVKRMSARLKTLTKTNADLPMK